MAIEMDMPQGVMLPTLISSQEELDNFLLEWARSEEVRSEVPEEFIKMCEPIERNGRYYPSFYRFKFTIKDTPQFKKWVSVSAEDPSAVHPYAMEMLVLLQSLIAPGGIGSLGFSDPLDNPIIMGWVFYKDDIHPIYKDVPESDDGFIFDCRIPTNIKSEEELMSSIFGWEKFVAPLIGTPKWVLSYLPSPLPSGDIRYSLFQFEYFKGYIEVIFFNEDDDFPYGAEEYLVSLLQSLLARNSRGYFLVTEDDQTIGRAFTRDEDFPIVDGFINMGDGRIPLKEWKRG